MWAVRPPGALEGAAVQVQLFQHAHPRRGERLRRRNRVVRQREAEHVAAEIAERHRQLQVVTPGTLASRQLLAADVSRG